MLNAFKQKKVLITGGASGLGKSLVDAFAQGGWSVWIADLNLEDSTALATTLKAQFPNSAFEATRCDITSETDFDALKTEIKSKWQSLGIIINNAGIASSGLLEETDLSKWNRTMETNLNGVYKGCFLLSPLLPNNSKGHIVNIASFAGIAHAPGMVAYNVSKAAVIALSESLNVELAHRDIGVTVACPAFFQTNLVDSMKESNEYVRNQVQKWMAASKVNADDVAKDIISAIEKNKFMVISHDYARKIYWLKRFFPNYYMRKVKATVPKLKQRLNAQ